MGSISGTVIVIYLAIVVLMIVAMWKVFTKAGEPGWACIIPIYSTIVMLKIVGKPWWWLLLFLIPLVGLVWAVWMVNMLSKSFGKSEGFTVGLIFLPFIFIPILGFGDAKYLGPYGDPAAFRTYGNKQGFDFEQNKLEN
jgi:uncharacterized membrane protein YoaK (UPF0700 family)